MTNIKEEGKKTTLGTQVGNKNRYRSDLKYQNVLYQLIPIYLKTQEKGKRINKLTIFGNQNRFNNYGRSKIGY